MVCSVLHIAMLAEFVLPGLMQKCNTLLKGVQQRGGDKVRREEVTPRLKVRREE